MSPEPEGHQLPSSKRRFKPADQAVLPRLQRSSHWADIEDRLKRGDPVSRTATWIREELKLCTDNAIATIRNALLGYRKHLPPASIVGARDPLIVQRMRVQLKQGGALLDGLIWLKGLQERRIRQARKTEEKLPVTMRQLTEDIREHREICKVIAELAMELGLAQRAPAQMHLTGTSLYADVTKLSPESRQRVLEAASRLVRKAGKGPRALGEGAGDGGGGGGGDQGGGG